MTLVEIKVVLMYKNILSFQTKIVLSSDNRYYCPTEQLSDYTSYPCKEGFYCISGATVPDPLDGITGWISVYFF